MEDVGYSFSEKKKTLDSSRIKIDGCFSKDNHIIGIILVRTDARVPILNPLFWVPYQIHSENLLSLLTSLFIV
jgi:hypothetical protein